MRRKHASRVCVSHHHVAHPSFKYRRVYKTVFQLVHPALLILISVFTASSHVRKLRTVGKGPSNGSGGPANGTVVRSAEEKTAEYAVFALVPIFCVMGLLGILICNILKKKGYRCSAEKEGGDEETATPQKEGERLTESIGEEGKGSVKESRRRRLKERKNIRSTVHNGKFGVFTGTSLRFPVVSVRVSLLCDYMQSFMGVFLFGNLSCFEL